MKVKVLIFQSCKSCQRHFVQQTVLTITNSRKASISIFNFQFSVFSFSHFHFTAQVSTCQPAWPRVRWQFVENSELDKLSYKIDAFLSILKSHSIYIVSLITNCYLDKIRDVIVFLTKCYFRQLLSNLLKGKKVSKKEKVDNKDWHN